MSAETYSNLQDAIAAHVQDVTDRDDGDRGTRMVTDWTIAVAHVDTDPRFVMYNFFGSPSAPHSIEGLLRRAERNLEKVYGE